jgi:hypothetical protein
MDSVDAKPPENGEAASWIPEGVRTRLRAKCLVQGNPTGPA